MENTSRIQALLFFVLLLLLSSCEKEMGTDPIESNFETIKTEDWESNIGIEYKTDGILVETGGLYYLVSSASDLENDALIPENRNINLAISNNIIQQFSPTEYLGKQVSVTGILIKNTNSSILGSATVLGNPSLATLQINELIDIEILNPTPLIPIPEIWNVCDRFPQLCIPQTPNEYKFALIYSGGVNQRNAHLRYWNDVNLMYHILREQGYPAANIRIVYKDGVAEGPDMAPVHFAANAGGLNAAIDYLKERMDGQSKFFLMMNNHGGGEFLPSDPSSIAGGILDTDGDETRTEKPSDNIDEQYYFYEDHSVRLTDDLMAQKINELSFYDMIAVIKPCYSGGVIWDFKGDNRVILTSGTEDEITYAHTSLLYGEQTYHFFSAIMQEDVLTGTPVLSDMDGNGRISMYEAQKYIIEHDVRNESPQFEDDNDGVGVSLGMPTGYGASAFLD